MVDKSTFPSEEWQLLLISPMLAGMAVTLAEPSGLLGMLKESFASTSALLSAKKDAGINALAKAIAADLETAEGRTAVRDGMKAQMTAKTPAELKVQALDGLKKANALIAAKAPAEAAGFRAWLNDIAVKASEASSEGGFLGFGGVKVSDAEKATIAEVAAALS